MMYTYCFSVIVCGQPMEIGSEMHAIPEKMTSSAPVTSLSVASLGTLNNPAGSWVPKLVCTKTYIDK